MKVALTEAEERRGGQSTLVLTSDNPMKHLPKPTLADIKIRQRAEHIRKGIRTRTLSTSDCTYTGHHDCGGSHNDKPLPRDLEDITLSRRCKVAP